MITLSMLRALAGAPPSRVPLAPSVIERVDCGAFERLKIGYYAEEGDCVPAYLLIPKGRTCLPAVYCHHQHAGQYHLGKSEVAGLAGDPDQAFGAELARRGYAVLAPDAIAFEERNWSDRPGHAQYFELTTRLVRGQTLLAKVLHDVSVGVDYLCSLPEVDPGRIGFLGHSYGGRMAIWATAFDSRIRASVSNCGCVGYRDSLARHVGIQAEFCVPGVMELGDIEDIVSLIAPRALYLSAAADDKYSRGVQRIYQTAKAVFPAGRLAYRVWDGGHAFTKEMRHAAYQFLDDHL